MIDSNRFSDFSLAAKAVHGYPLPEEAFRPLAVPI